MTTQQQIEDIQGLLAAHREHWITLEQSYIEILVQRLISLKAAQYTIVNS